MFGKIRVHYIQQMKCKIFPYRKVDFNNTDNNWSLSLTLCSLFTDR